MVALGDLSKTSIVSVWPSTIKDKREREKKGEAGEGINIVCVWRSIPM